MLSKTVKSSVCQSSHKFTATSPGSTQIQILVMLVINKMIIIISFEIGQPNFVVCSSVEWIF